MVEIEKDMICHYCLGCNRLENMEFKGVRRCDNYAQGKLTVEDYIKEIKKKLGVK